MRCLRPFGAVALDCSDGGLLFLGCHKVAMGQLHGTLRGQRQGPAVLTREYIKLRGRCRQYFWFDVTGGVRHHGGITG